VLLVFVEVQTNVSPDATVTTAPSANAADPASDMFVQLYVDV